MNKQIIGLAGAACAALSVSNVYAGPEPVSAVGDPMLASEPSFDLSVALNSDNFFGFYPSFAGSYGLTDTIDFTAYGIFWAAGNGGDANGTLGNDWGEWNEFGAGLNFEVTEYLSINPQVGLLSGSLLYNGTNGPGELNDGWVPNITINLDTEKWEGQIYSGLYLPFKDSDPGAQDSEFLHSWINFGYKVNNVFSCGVHLEHLSGGVGNSATETAAFTWAGPYIQFRNEEKGIFARFAGGWAAHSFEDEDTFWKASVGFSF